MSSNLAMKCGAVQEKAGDLPLTASERIEARVAQIRSDRAVPMAVDEQIKAARVARGEGKDTLFRSRRRKRHAFFSDDEGNSESDAESSSDDSNDTCREGAAKHHAEDDGGVGDGGGDSGGGGDDDGCGGGGGGHTGIGGDTLGGEAAAKMRTKGGKGGKGGTEVPGREAEDMPRQWFMKTLVTRKEAAFRSMLTACVDDCSIGMFQKIPGDLEGCLQTIALIRSKHSMSGTDKRAELLHSFASKMKIGDTLFIGQGTCTVWYEAVVTSEYYHVPQDQLGLLHPNCHRRESGPVRVLLVVVSVCERPRSRTCEQL